MQKKSGCSEKEIIAILQQLHKDEIVDFLFSNSDSEIIFLQPREDDKTINRIAKVVEQQQQLKQNQVRSVINYINNDDKCKQRLLLEYFGEYHSSNCGKCTVCQNQTNTVSSDTEAMRMAVLEILENEALSSRAITEKLGEDKSDILNVIRDLLEEEIIVATSTNTYIIKHNE